MVLVDTSVWVDHLRRATPMLATVLEDALVVTHPFVIGEIACGSIARRSEVLGLLQLLPQSPVAGDTEVLAMVEHRRLWGRGLGWVDVHLLAAAQLAGAQLWTRDRRLRACAAGLGIDFAP